VPYVFSGWPFVGVSQFFLFKIQKKKDLLLFFKNIKELNYIF